MSPADRITRDEVMLKLRKQGELRAQGNRAQSAKKSFLRANKAIRATVPTRASKRLVPERQEPNRKVGDVTPSKGPGDQGHQIDRAAST